jgi:hypothetical protein
VAHGPVHVDGEQMGNEPSHPYEREDDPVASQAVEKHVAGGDRDDCGALNQKNMRAWYVGQKLFLIHSTKPPLRSDSSRMCTTNDARNAQKRRLRISIRQLHARWSRQLVASHLTPKRTPAMRDETHAAPSVATPAADARARARTM